MNEEQVKEWLVNNPDKWENDLEFKFLVPIDDVPREVVEYVTNRQAADRDLMNEINEYAQLGLNDN